ncbi:MAG: SDR family oxidoreductase [Alphaproteobacteria bacterium]
MNVSVKDRRVIVTAAASGIGRAIAEGFADGDARVHVCDIDADGLHDLRSARPEIGTTPADVSDPADVDRLFDEATGSLGGLDVLVNNAGIAGPSAQVEDVTPEEWERTLAVNINGQFHCARRAVPLLKRAGGGAIVNISSTAGLFGYPFRSPYAASKWAVIGFTKTLAMELGEHGIRVNAICPGAVEGPRMDRVIAAAARVQGTSPDQVRKSYLRQVSLGTFVEAREIAETVLFLCSDAGRKISGQALSVDGHTETLRG